MQSPVAISFLSINDSKLTRVIQHMLIALTTVFSINTTTRAQTNLPADSLMVNDSIRIQTTLGTFHYGRYVAHTDSLLLLTNVFQYDTTAYQMSRVAEIILLDRRTNATTIPIVASKPMQNVTTELQAGVLPKNKNEAKQIIYGSGAFIAGALGGAIGGALIGAAIGSLEATGAGFFIGAVGGSTLLATRVIVQTGDTNKVKGKFGATFAGVVLGSVGSVVFPLAIFVAPALVGVIFYNKSRYQVAQ